MSNYLDSRDLEEEIQELEEREKDKENPLNEEEKEHLKALRELKEECENYGWDSGICFIPEHMFEDYARELAEDCYSMDKNNPLTNYIDWERWSNDVEMDYSNIEFEGTDYLYREA